MRVVVGGTAIIIMTLKQRKRLAGGGVCVCVCVCGGGGGGGGVLARLDRKGEGERRQSE